VSRYVIIGSDDEEKPKTILGICEGSNPTRVEASDRESRMQEDVRLRLDMDEFGPNVYCAYFLKQGAKGEFDVTGTYENVDFTDGHGPHVYCCFFHLFQPL
jgi:hypothetical protein